jgi:hypothetical protein
MQFMGFNPAGQYFTDPERYDRMEERYSKKDWQRKERGDKREQQRYGGPD